jgi:precorrin-6Y C5,15-methyltransferase (decarboxylating)
LRRSENQRGRVEARIPSPSAPRPPPVTVVGLGDDGPAGLGERAREVVWSAELLAGGRRELEFFLDHPAEKLPITNNVEDVTSKLAVESAQRRCVVLASGDPCFFGIGPILAERLGREQVEIIPQASSVALAFARLGLAWEDATVLSAHGRPLANMLGPAVAAGKLAVLTDDENTPGVIAEALLAAGMADCPAFVLEHLGGPNERVVETSLADLPGRQHARLNVLVALPGNGGVGAGFPRRGRGNRAPTDSFSAFGRPESDFRHARGQITKAEVRAVALAKLRLLPDSVLWDVGAGSGSLSVEAAGLMPRGTIYAVERDPEQLDCIRVNIRRLRAPQVRLVHGEAPQALEDLPRPDRVFVGGGGPAIAAILECCLGRLGDHGRLVANAATIESAIEAQECLKGRGWQVELVQLGVARGRVVGGRTRLGALDPVFNLSGWPAQGDAGPGDTGTRGRGDAGTGGRGETARRRLGDSGTHGDAQLERPDGGT